MVAATKSAIGAESHGVHNLSQIALDVPCETTRLNPAGFWTCFGFNVSYPSVYTFWNGNIYLMSLNIRRLAFHLHRGSQLRVCLRS